MRARRRAGNGCCCIVIAALYFPLVIFGRLGRLAGGRRRKEGGEG